VRITSNSVCSSAAGPAAAAAPGRHGDGSGGRNAPLLFEQLRKLSGFEDGQSRQVVDDFVQVSHFILLGGIAPMSCVVETKNLSCGLGGENARQLATRLLGDAGDLGRGRLDEAHDVPRS
jgi:hypothetical protein